MSTPVGIRNKNYLNVKNGTTPWLDAGGGNSKTDPKGHAIFTDPSYGVRAGILLLRSYYFRHNRRTVAEILSRWAPSTDTVGSIPGAPPNSPAEYTRFVTARMGIGPNNRLEIFDPVDQTIGNITQLRELVFAMAAYEIGDGFKVPVPQFNAALDLIEPGILKDGTDDHATNSLLARVSSGWTISASVGDWAKGAKNNPEDVKTVQAMLRQVSAILRVPAYDPLGNDGKIAKTAGKSDTIRAINAFQSRIFIRPDGLIDPDGKTFREMLRIIETGPLKDDTSGTGGAPKCYFPFASLPASNWTAAPRSFAARRDDGRRAHAGCDLYFPAGTTVNAITDGVVVRGPYYFYSGTYAIEVDHGTFLARYGEIAGDALVRSGDRVTAGQPIAKVGHLVGVNVPSDMLHLEIYGKTSSGQLTVAASDSAKTADGIPFMRRKDLMDPTPLLDQWRSNLPGMTVRSRITSPNTLIPATGFCIHLKRVRQEQRQGKNFARTVGNYQCYWNGSPVAGMQGQIVERGGPGDNTTEIGVNQHRRIRAGTYPLAIQDGSHYKTRDYTDGKPYPRPGIALRNTGDRTAILIHPGEDYLNSIGCLNPCSGLTDADSKINFTDSRDRVIAIIDALRSNLGPRFPASGTIPEAFIVIDKEPT